VVDGHHAVAIERVLELGGYQHFTLVWLGVGIGVGVQERFCTHINLFHTKNSQGSAYKFTLDNTHPSTTTISPNIIHYYIYVPLSLVPSCVGHLDSKLGSHTSTEHSHVLSVLVYLLYIRERSKYYVYSRDLKMRQYSPSRSPGVRALEEHLSTQYSAIARV
jgi:hypothetical protein